MQTKSLVRGALSVILLVHWWFEEPSQMFWPHDFAITLSWSLRPAALRSEWLSLPFWPFLAWTGIFVGSQPSSLQVLLLRFYRVTPADARNTSFVSLFHSQMCVCVCLRRGVSRHVTSRLFSFALSYSPLPRSVHVRSGRFRTEFLRQVCCLPVWPVSRPPPPGWVVDLAAACCM